MLKLKSCPKCKEGATTLDRDLYGWYEYCLQCGHIRDLVNMTELEQKPLSSVEAAKRKLRDSGKGK